MKSTTTTSLLLPFLLPLTTLAQSSCPTGIHMIVARASTEAPGTGIIGAVADDIQDRIPGSDIEAVDYPAELNPYEPSQTEGLTEMTRLVNDFAARCPDTQMVLLGYSQGAHVAADVVCGASSAGFPQTAPVADEVKDKIAAVVLMGDPSHVPEAEFNAGSATNEGFFPRQDLAGCEPITEKMVSFCNSRDTFCDSGRSIFTHLRYVQTDGDEAVDFVVLKVNGA